MVGKHWEILTTNLVSESVAGEVAHYTRMGNVAHFLPGPESGWRSLWSTPVQFLNDRRELTHGLEVFERVADSFPEVRGRASFIASQILRTSTIRILAYQVSFSSNLDDLGQWRAYAANGMGCAVVTSATDLIGAYDVTGFVIYDEQKQVDFARDLLVELNALDSHAGTGSIDEEDLYRLVIAAACFMKDKGFQQEQEFRAIAFPSAESIRFREVGERIAPYTDVLKDGKKSLPVSQIIVGPGWQLAGMSESERRRHHVLQALIALIGLRDMSETTLIRVSEIPFDPR